MSEIKGSRCDVVVDLLLFLVVMPASTTRGGRPRSVCAYLLETLGQQQSRRTSANDEELYMGSVLDNIVHRRPGLYPRIFQETPILV